MSKALQIYDTVTAKERDLFCPHIKSCMIINNV